MVEGSGSWLTWQWKGGRNGAEACLQGPPDLPGEGHVALGPAPGRRLAGVHLGGKLEGADRLLQRLRLRVDVDKHQRLAVTPQARLHGGVALTFQGGESVQATPAERVLSQASFYVA